MTRFVGQVRVRTGDAYGELSPSVAEQLTLCVLRGTPVHGQYDEVAKAYTQFVLLKDIASGFEGRSLRHFWPKPEMTPDDRRRNNSGPD